MTSITVCPACGKNSWLKHLSCVDHTVSHETFTLTKCSNCEVVATNPRPSNAELGAYYISDSYISHTSAASSIIDRIYLLARTYTLKWKHSLINRHATQSRRLLDYGCGTGDFLTFCNKNGWSVTGVEPSSSARKIASSKTNALVHADLSEVTHTSFDTITLWHVLEHVPDPEVLIGRLNSLLERDGTLFIAVPNYKSFDAQYYKSHWAAYDVPRHLWHFTIDSMKNLLTKNGLHVIKITPMKLDAYYVSLLSEKYLRNGNTTLLSMMKAFMKGLNSNLSARKTGEYSSLIYTVKKNAQ